MATPVTTIVPFSSLPTCALQCGHLYDANGACVPPAVQTGDIGAYAKCFCADSRVTAFSTGTAGVCDSACTAAADSGGLQSIQGWFTSFCSEYETAVQTTTTSSAASATSTTSRSGSSSGSKGHQSWMDGHWRWVVFIVVMVVGIVGIWVGACIFHRRYLRRKDRQYALGNPLAVRASTGAASAAGLTASATRPDAHNSEVPGVFAGGDLDMDTDPAYPEKRRSKLMGRRRN